MQIGSRRHCHGNKRQGLTTQPVTQTQLMAVEQNQHSNVVSEAYPHMLPVPFKDRRGAESRTRALIAGEREQLGELHAVERGGQM